MRGDRMANDINNKINISKNSQTKKFFFYLFIVF